MDSVFLNNNLKPKKVLVTGALGHIGARLVRELHRANVTEVIMVDNLDSRRFSSLYELPEGLVKYRFIEEDIRMADFKPLLVGVDAVIHLAAITNAEASKEIPILVREVNLDGAKRVAEACLEAGVPFFFPSTTSVYGSQGSLVDEDCVDLLPQSPYAESKLAMEKHLQVLGQQGLRFVICRFGTIFGHSIGKRYDTAVNKFTWQAVNGKPLTVWRTALKQKRPYLYLGDCVNAVNFIIEQDLFDGEVYNILTDNFTVEEIVNTIKTFIPTVEITLVDSAIMNQLSYEVDHAKIKNKGFKPTGQLADGIKESIDHLRKIIAA
ncbi:MAG: NAD(P)-dependent oxidoreductase [bacterium]|nr:NAD(P)-dependent oxidoreductase [bacterium]